MPSPSNIYAEKVYSEHPIAMWALDEIADYSSIINEEFRQFDNSDIWTVSNATMLDVQTTSEDIIVPPFINSHLSVSSTLDGGTNKTIQLLSDFVPNIYSSGSLSFKDLDFNLGTITVGTYVYPVSEYAQGYEIGYQYYDSVSGETVEVTKSFDITINNKWLHVAATLPLVDQNVSFKLLFRARVRTSGNNQYLHGFYYNGLTLGQWSEEFCSTSLGSTIVDIPETINFLPSGYKAISANAYAREDLPGYYLVKDTTIFAKNSGMPLVYGAPNSTILYPNTEEQNAPSLIVPGMGFLNESGRYRNFTAELWVNINASTGELKRFFGPVASTDGLYVDGPFIGLKIGDNYATHYVGEWARPMLIHIRYISDFASLLINGEEVLSFKIDQSKLTLPERFTNAGKELDWLGFYTNDNISPISVDCFAIYGYQVISVLAKRRFVYGQGVEFPENINNAYSGTTAFFDYSFAKYPNNYSYPDSGLWNQGITNNVNVENGYLQSPSYEPPKVVFNTNGNDVTDSWISALSAIQQESDLFISLKPNSDWSNLGGYIYFDKYQAIGESVSAFYGIFKVSSLSQEEQVLFRIENQSLKKYFEIVLINGLLQYRFKDGLSDTIVLYESNAVKVGEQFTVGISVKDFVNYFGNNMRSFFANPDQLQMFVGGTREFSKKFTGKIYAIALANAQNMQLVPEMFSSRGVPVDFENVFDTYDFGIEYDAGDQYFGQDGSYWQYLLDGGTPTSFVTTRAIQHTATYTLKPVLEFDVFKLAVAARSSWEDYIPLTYFAKYVTTANGKQHYDLDFIQFNIDYPAPSHFASVPGEPKTWTYGELYVDYSLPAKKTYSLLDNHLFTGYDTYTDLQQKTSSAYIYDTSDSMVKTYIMFVPTAALTGSSVNRFSKTESLPKSGIVVPGEDWETTRYEVVNNCIIYPPKDVDVTKVAIVTQLEMVNETTNIRTISIRSIQYASQSLDNASPAKIGTRFGVEAVPYRQNGFYVDYKSENPFSIYKGSTPYLYNTRYSGIQIRGLFSPTINRGISIPINPTKANNFEIMAMQLMARYDEDFFPATPIEVFEIQGKRDYIKVFLVATSPNGKRAKLYAVNANTGQLDANVAFYLNGKITKDATLNVKEWATIGISFSSIMNVSLVSGSIKINGPLLINNVSYYQSTSIREQQQIQKRNWTNVLNVGGQNDLVWDFWDALIWNDVLVLTSTSLFGVNPADIFKAYTGTNKVIIDDFAPDDDAPNLFVLTDYEYRVYSGTSWSSTVRDAL